MEDPQYLYRYFEDEMHADNFANNGEIMLSQPREWGKIAGELKDRDEGTSYRSSGTVVVLDGKLYGTKDNIEKFNRVNALGLKNRINISNIKEAIISGNTHIADSPIVCFCTSYSDKYWDTECRSRKNRMFVVQIARPKEYIHTKCLVLDNIFATHFNCVSKQFCNPVIYSREVMPQEEDHPLLRLLRKESKKEYIEESEYRFIAIPRNQNIQATSFLLTAQELTPYLSRID